MKIHAITAMAVLSTVLAASAGGQDTPASPAPAPAVEPAAAAARLEVRREDALSRFGLVDREDHEMPATENMGTVYSVPINKAGALSLRFRFEVLRPAPRWIVQIIKAIEGTDVVVWAHSSLESNATSFWSDEIPGNRVRVEVISFDRNTPLLIKIADVVRGVTPSATKSITKPDERWKIRTVPEGASAEVKNQWKQIQQLGKAVARIRFVGDDRDAYFCTGFMVTKDLLMTNDHCMDSKAEVESALIDFNYLTDTTPLNPVTIKEEVARSVGLDYALYRLNRPVTAAPLKLTRNAAVGENQQLLIIEHPRGEPQQVSIKNCVVRGIDVVGVEAGVKTDFGHLCDTLGGSSGSPLFEDLTSGVVAGLHHFGFTRGVVDPVNQGVRMLLIRNDIAARNAAAAAEIP